MERQNVTQTIQEDEMEIDLFEIFQLLWRSAWKIILIAIFGMILSGVLAYYFIAPEYDATSSIYIVSASSESLVNLSDLQIGTSLTSDYKELVLSRPVLQSVIQNLGLEAEMNYVDLAEAITISNPSGTRILRITARSKDPQLAMQIANEMMTISIAWLPEIMQSTAPNVVEEAIVPVRQASLGYTSYALLGAIAMVFLYCIIVIVKYMMHNTIRTADEFERYFGIAPLAVLVEEKVVYANKRKSKEGGKKSQRGGTHENNK